VRHRSSLFIGALVAALLLTAPALAVRVHVRVEGARATVFGSTEPLVTPLTGTWAPPDGPALTVPAATPLGALEQASRRGEFYYRVQSTGFGPYVDRIGRLAGSGITGWVYKVNGVSPPVGADKYALEQGDRVLWYYARFGPAGGPKTLRMRRLLRHADCASAPCPELTRLCFTAVAQDDNGRREVVRGVVFLLDGQRVVRRGSTLCLRAARHWHTVRVSKRGFVRSEVAIGPRRGVRAAVAAATALAGRR
jgi:Domain of unknown function (DUF4430)